MTSIEPSYPTPAVYARLALLAAGLFVVGTNGFVIAGVLPDIARSLGVSEAIASYSITSYALVVAVASPAVSILFARASRTRLMATGLALIAIGTAVSAVAPDFAVFTAGRVVAAFGGAALVPAATAAAPSLMPSAMRGRALAIAGLGFTLAVAIGSPLGTALASVGGWRLPLAALAVIALALTVLVAALVRDVPVGVATGLRARFAPLRDGRVVLVLVATLLLTAGFNIVYIFSSAVARPATGGSGTQLAVLLLLYGVGGIAGTALGGRAADRIGSRTAVAVALGVEAVVLLAVPLLGGSFPAFAIAFAVWGVTAFGAVVPLQHRLVGIDPASAGLALSWYSTAMYVGIAIAPVVGAAALAVGAALVPVAGAVATVLALLTFQAGFLARRAAAAA